MSEQGKQVGLSEYCEDSCPRCGSPTGYKYPRGLTPYCEDCGYPDEDFDKTLEEEDE